MTDGRRAGLSVPAHVGVLVGLSAGAYALTLAAVAGLQSSAEMAARAEQAPSVAAIEAMVGAHDALQVQLDRARAAYETAAGAYGSVGPEVAGLEARIADLSAAVADVSGTAASLPSSVKLPRVSRSVAVAPAPATQATTRASGG